MFTRAEKGYLALTLSFLAAGCGIKAYRHASVQIGPFPDPAFAGSRSPGQTTPDYPRLVTGADFSTAPGRDSSVREVQALGSGIQDTSLALARAESRGGTDSTDSTDKEDKEDKEDKVGVPRPPSAPIAKKSDFAGKVDVNRADVAGLSQVKGIGGKTAQAIIRHRQAHGPFREWRDLLQVKGIGEKKLEKLKPYLIL